jgi:hypothetical protein
MYYRVERRSFNLGDKISKGEFGKTIKYRDSHLKLRELVLEEYRKKFFPNKVSRLDCGFVFNSLKSVELHIKKNFNTKEHAFIYQVEFCNIDSNTHFGNYSCLPDCEALIKENTIDEICHAYWTDVELLLGGKKVAVAVQGYGVIEEILVDSDLKVVDLL